MKVVAFLFILAATAVFPVLRLTAVIDWGWLTVASASVSANVVVSFLIVATICLRAISYRVQRGIGGRFSVALVALGLLSTMMPIPSMAADATTIDLSPIYSTGVEFIAALVSGLLIALLGWIAALVKRKTGVDIDAKYRETLHSALMTGVTAGLTKLGDKLPGQVDVKSALIAEGVSWAEQAAADAIKHFGVTPDQLETLAASKVAQVLGTSGSTSTDPSQ